MTRIERPLPVNPGDRVAHRHGFFGTALAPEADGAVRVRHDSGAVSTWAAEDVAVVTRAPLSLNPQPRRRRTAGAKGARQKKKVTAKKRPARKVSGRKAKTKKRRVKATKRVAKPGKKKSPAKRKTRKRR